MGKCKHVWPQSNNFPRMIKIREEPNMIFFTSLRGRCLYSVKSECMRKNQIAYHSYADDTQIYIALSPNDYSPIDYIKYISILNRRLK